MSSPEQTIHASAILIGERAVLIRGESGTGKSQLTTALLNAAREGLLPYARLIADDRVKIFVANGRLLSAAPEAIQGMMEVRGLGIRHADYEPIAVVGLVIDLAASDGARMPDEKTEKAEILGIKITRLPVAAGQDPFPVVLAALTTKTKV